jgi:hypothetical protein
MKKMI